MTHQFIAELSKYENKEVTLKGWVANKRSGKGLFFIVLRDGTGFAQCVVDQTNVSEQSFKFADQLNLESSVELKGIVIKDKKQLGGYELQVKEVKTISIAEEYPIAKKEHGVDFLMDKRHLWLRSKRQWAIMRIRNRVIFSIHQFFQENGFVQMDAPIITANACEGTTTLFETDFYGEQAFLSQSGQLYGEAMAFAQNKIYTFGPTFRAEKSKTRRHLSEFWMIEPEMVFYDNDRNMDLIEAFLKRILKDVTTDCVQEFEALDRKITVLEDSSKSVFPRISYTDAVAILKGEKDVEGKHSIQVLEEDLKEVLERKKVVSEDIKERELIVNDSNVKKGVRNFNATKVADLKGELKDIEEKERNIPNWIQSAKDFEFGNDFGGSDETVITRLFSTPIMVYNWPHEVKAFYMKRDENDSRFAKGVDVLAPEGYGEIVGGGERETNKEWLIEKIKEHKLPMEAFQWYLDLRSYGSVPHAGFGLGLERLICWICKLQHVRESIPFPRMMGRALP